VDPVIRTVGESLVETMGFISPAVAAVRQVGSSLVTR